MNEKKQSIVGLLRFIPERQNYTVSQTYSRHCRLTLENQLSDFDIFW